MRFNKEIDGRNLRQIAVARHQRDREHERTALSDLEANRYLNQHDEFVLLHKAPHADEWEQLSKRLRFYLLAVRLVTPVASCPRVIFNFQEGDTEALAMPENEQVYVHPRDRGVTFSEVVLPEVGNLFEKLRQALTTTPNRIISAIRSFQHAQTAAWDLDKFAHYGACLESLFGQESQEISFRLQTRIAWFLSRKHAGERDGIFEKIGKMYKFRSLMVHGNLSGLKLNEQEGRERLDLIADIEGYIRRIFQRMASEEEAWKLLTVKHARNTKAVRGYFKELVLGGSGTGYAVNT